MMRTILALFFLSCVAALAQERMACPAGATTFSIQYGDKIDCSLTTSTHRYQFQAAANDIVGFHLVRTSGTGTPCITVENSTGVTLLTRLCTLVASVPGDRDAVRITTSGTYTLVITENGTTFQPYQYTLILERVAPPTPRAQLIAPTQTIRGAINPIGDRDFYRFQVEAGDQFSFRLTKLSGNSEIQMRFIDSLGAIRGLGSGAVLTAPTTGTLGLWVVDSGDNEVGEYDLTFGCTGRCPRPPPVFTGIFNAANQNAAVCSGAFASMFGSWISTVARIWDRRDFTGNAMPMTLEGAKADIGGSSPYVYYVSPGQMNVIIPALPTGSNNLKITTPAGDSQTASVKIASFCPAVFMFADQRYVVAVYPDRAVARTPSVPGRSLRPGDIVSVFATGLGATTPAYPEGELVPVPLATTNPVSVQVGGLPADVLYSGLIASGLYQINLRVPTVAVGEQSFRIEIAGVRSPEGVSILVSQP